MYVHRGVCTGTCENAIIDSPTDEKCVGHAASVCALRFFRFSFGLLGSRTSGKLTVRERMVFYRLLPYRLFEKRCGPFVRGLQPKRFLLLVMLDFTNSNLRNLACWRSVFAALAPQLSAKF